MRRIYFFLILLLPVLASAQSVSFDQETKPKAEEFSVYPNPAFDDVVYVTTDIPGQKDIAIYDVFGKMVFRQPLNSARLDISRLDPGVYLLKLTTGNRMITRKLIVK